MDLDEQDSDLVMQAIEEGTRRALLRHKRLAQSVVFYQEGRIVIVPAEEIEVSELPLPGFEANEF